MLVPSFNKSMYETLCRFRHSAYQYMKHCVDAFIQHIDVWNIVLIPSLNISIYETVPIPSFSISIYETLCRFLHSAYRYMKHCLESFIQHIDVRNIVLMPSLNTSIYEQCLGSFFQHIDIWNIVSIPSFSISIYETLCWCLHSTYRYMKHCLDSFIQHIDTRNSVMNTSGNIAICGTCSETFQQLRHVWNMLNPSAIISIYATYYELFGQRSFKSRHDNLVPRYVQFKVFKTSSIVRYVGRQIKTFATLSNNWYKMCISGIQFIHAPIWGNLLESQTLMNVNI